MKRFKNRVMSLCLAIGMMIYGINSLAYGDQDESITEAVTPECDEDGDPLTPSLECGIWQVHVDFTFDGVKISCSTGGKYKCSTK